MKKDHIIDVPNATGKDFYCCGNCKLVCTECEHKGMQFVREINVGIEGEEIICPFCAEVFKIKKETPSRMPV
jgi:uncharacterized protein YbaR (Trm112 family)